MGGGGGVVAQWLAPQISYANREVGGSNLIVSTDDPLTTGASVVNAQIRKRVYAAPRFTQPNVQEIVHED